jgi:hypothetical protein
MLHGRWFLLLGMALAAAVIAGCGGGSSGVAPGGDDQMTVVPPRGSTVLAPRDFNTSDLRWLDIAEYPYASSFMDPLFYSRAGSYAAVTWADSSTTLSGTLTAVKLKPNFAYQMKLGSLSAIIGPNPDVPPSPSDAEAWANWQLGHNGRWWCGTCGWNVSDADLRTGAHSNHEVYGYLLFDFFLTDTNGNATKNFALNSTYHVLWRTNQRRRTSSDSPAVSLKIVRGAWGYGFTRSQSGPKVSVYAEWEPNRPKPGGVRLAAGTYPVVLSLTEESFHDNLGNTVPYGGFWATPVEAPIEFTVQ